VFVTEESDIDRVYLGGERIVERGKALHQDTHKILDEVERRSPAAHSPSQ